MKKKIIAMLVMFLFCFSMGIPVFADDMEGFADEYYRVNDLADILTDSEEKTLCKKLDEISQRQKMDVTLATVEDLEDYDNAAEYADDMYEFCNYGYGQEKDGILLLISMKERDWVIFTCGYGTVAFTDAGIEYIGKQMKENLSDENYAVAFEIYAEQSDAFITQARKGTPYDKGNLPREPLSMMWIPISVAIGVVLALIVVGVMKGKLKTVRSQAAANSYMKKDSLMVTESSDLFLYHTVKRSEKKKEDDSGSSTHKSSSGTTHGGGGGKF